MQVNQLTSLLPVLPPLSCEKNLTMIRGLASVLAAGRAAVVSTRLGGDAQLAAPAGEHPARPTIGWTRMREPASHDTPRRQVTKDNFNQLRVAGAQYRLLGRGLTRSMAPPPAVDRVLYTTAAASRRLALNPTTGEMSASLGGLGVRCQSDPPWCWPRHLLLGAANGQSGESLRHARLPVKAPTRIPARVPSSERRRCRSEAEAGRNRSQHRRDGSHATPLVVGDVIVVVMAHRPGQRRGMRMRRVGAVLHVSTASGCVFHTFLSRRFLLRHVAGARPDINGTPACGRR